MQNLTITSWNVDQIRGYERHLRRNDEAVERMVRSIEAYGFRIPVLVTAEGEMVDGELRVKAARQMGWRAVPAIVCEGWTRDQVRGFRLMANQSSNWASWDWDLVALELAELRVEDFDLDLTGFSGVEIEALGLEDFAEELGGAAEDETAAVRCPLCQKRMD